MALLGPKTLMLKHVIELNWHQIIVKKKCNFYYEKPEIYQNGNTWSEYPF